MYIFIVFIDKCVYLHTETELTYMYMQLRVKEILKERGLSQKDLAGKMGVAEISLSRSINGNPSMDTLIKMAEALDVEMGELFSARSNDEIICPKCGARFKIVE